MNLDEFNWNRINPQISWGAFEKKFSNDTSCFFCEGKFPKSGVWMALL